MSSRNEKLNPILAIAIQAKSAEERGAHEREQAQRADREGADRYRRLASRNGFSVSTGFPTVCTIH